MTPSVLVVGEATRLHALVSDLVEWSEAIFLCFGHESRDEREWPVREVHLSKVERAVLWGDACSSPSLLRALEERGTLRLANTGEVHANFLVGRRGSVVRAVTALPRFSVQGSQPVVSAVYCEADEQDDLALGLQRLREACCSRGRVPSAGEVEALIGEANEGKHSPPSGALPASGVYSAVPHIEIANCLFAVSDAHDVERAFAAVCDVLNVPPVAIRPDEWYPRGELWVRPGDADNHWILGLRVAEPTEIDDEPHLELSVHTAGGDGRCGVFFARDGEAGPLVLLHRGAFRGQRQKDADVFWATTRYSRVQVDDAGRLIAAAPVCRVDSPQLVADLKAFAHEIRRLRGEPEGEDETEQRADFLELEIDEQAGLLHDALLAYGALERDEAIREAAQSLRQNGRVRYKRLRSGGDLYETLSSALDAGCKEGLFDRPKRGHIRAICPEMTDDLWRVCVLGALDGDTSVDRDEVCRSAAEIAAEAFGLEYQRIRSGGRIERAVKSAVNSLIRRGLVEPDGRQKLRRIATG